MSFTQRSDSGCPQQTSRREDCHFVRNVRVQPTALSATIQEQCAVIDDYLSTPPFGVEPHTRKLDCSRIEIGLLFSDASPDSISAVMTIVFVCGNPVENA
ncbi:hypothetical protein TNCV_1382381 [Trichonephila clavipes]|nr:hypothetical protein TNCV_1382381 [Trichonephila clavipes]